MSEARKPAGPRKVWRMSSETPTGAFVDSSSPSAGTAARDQAGTATTKVLTPARVPSWHASSMDLLNGATARDVTETIPGELFDALFHPDSSRS